MRTLKKILETVNYIFLFVMIGGFMYGWTTVYPGETSTVLVWFLGISTILFFTIIDIVPMLDKK